MNKSKAKQQANADSLDFLDGLGTSKEQFDKIESVDEGIDVIVSSFIQRVKDNINDANLISSGKMQNIVMVQNGNEIEVQAPIYLLFQDKGVNGTEVNHNSPFSYGSKMPPIDDIKAWIKSKGFKSRNSGTFYKDKEFDVSDEKQVEIKAYAIAKSIQKKGITPKNIYSKEIPRLEEELKKAVPQIIINNFLNNLKKKK